MTVDFEAVAREAKLPAVTVKRAYGPTRRYFRYRGQRRWKLVGAGYRVEPIELERIARAAQRLREPLPFNTSRQ